jgi:hypothetical protein
VADHETDDERFAAIFCVLLDNHVAFIRGDAAHLRVQRSTLHVTSWTLASGLVERWHRRWQ